MKKYAIIKVVEGLKINAGETLSDDNIIAEEMAQTAMNESTKDNDPMFDTLEEAKEALKAYKASGRVDIVKVGKRRYWECYLTTYQLTEVNLDDDGEITEWGDIWDITPFEISIDNMGNVTEKWGK
jgi:hypothetical protein